MNKPGSDDIDYFFTLHTVGPGGSPDENGETTLDALIMNGVTVGLPTCQITY